MLIRHLDQIVGTEADVDADGWRSRRLLLKRDNMGFSMHDTIIKKGAELELWYKNHLEAVYCIEGEGEITDLDTGETHEINPGMLYALDKNDRHVLRANKGSEMRMVCVFNPPVSGREVHDKEGAYPADLD